VEDHQLNTLLKGAKYTLKRNIWVRKLT